MDEDVNGMGVVGSIERELLDVRSKIGNEKYAILVFWYRIIPKWPWQILTVVLARGCLVSARRQLAAGEL